MAVMRPNVPIALPDLDGINFGTKEARPEKDASIDARVARMAQRYQERGLRRTVEALVLVHSHGHPHVLLLRQGTEHAPIFRLPGGRLRVGEAEAEGMRRKLASKLGPPGGDPSGGGWLVHELLATWLRPHFDSVMYPYLPSHVTQPKETKKLFLVSVGPGATLAVPKRLQLRAVPLYDIYANPAMYGPLIASVPHLVSRFDFTKA